MLSLLVVASLSAGANAAEKISLVEEYSESIRDIELSSGAYDRQLIEPLQSLARLMSERGEYAEAVQVYTRLLHLSRINSGFYDEKHLGIVEKIIENNAAQGDWLAVNDNQSYSYWLSQRAYEQDGEKLTTEIHKVLDWKLMFLGLDDQRDKSRQLLELEIIAEHQLAVLEEHYGENHPALAPALYKRALVHYFYAVAIDESGPTGRRLEQKEAPQPAEDGTMSMPPRLPLLSNEETKPIIVSHLHKGKRLIERMAENLRMEAGSLEAKQAEAMARLYLADWELLMDRRKAALDGYKRSYRMLLEAGVDREDVNAFFARPVLIPAEEFHPIFLREPDSASLQTETGARCPEVSEVSATSHLQLGDYLAWTKFLPGVGFPSRAKPAYVPLDVEGCVELEFDVGLHGKTFRTKDPRFASARSAEGNSSQISIIGDRDIAAGKRRRALEETELMTFRPRLADGKPVASSKVRMSYFYSLDY